MTVESPDEDYVEKGGLRWGSDLEFGGTYSNLTYPFVTIRVSPERIHFEAKMWVMVNEQFDLAKSDLIAIRPVSGGLFHRLFAGVQFEHTKVDCPMTLVFWSSSRIDLLGRLREFGYPVVEEHESDSSFWWSPPKWSGPRSSAGRWR